MSKEIKGVLIESDSEWDELRKKYIGGSGISSILNLNPYETPAQYWRYKTGREQHPEANTAMLLGKFLEDGIARYFEHELGHRVIKCSADDIIYTHPDYPFLKGVPDRRLFIKGGGKAILEIKITNGIFDHDEIPEGWFCQPLFYTGLVNYDIYILAWFEFRTRELKIQEYDFDKGLYDDIVQKAVHFWKYNILQDIEPEPVNSSDILKKFPNHDPDKIIEATEELTELYSDLVTLKKNAKQIDEAIESKSEIVKLIFRDAEQIRYNDQLLFTFKTPKPSNKFNSKVFEIDHPALFEKYVKQIPGTRRFLIKPQ